MKKQKNESTPKITTVILEGFEVKALRLLIEDRLKKSDNRIVDIKGLCLIHNKMEQAELQFEVIPF